MRFAGTAKQYSKKAMHQESGMTSRSGAAGKRNCPYHAKVMKTLDTQSRRIGAIKAQVMKTPYIYPSPEPRRGLGGSPFRMSADPNTENVYQERIARFVELAEAAQKAADRAGGSRPNLQETYASIAQHWLALAHMAQSTIELNRSIAQQMNGFARDREEKRRG